MSAYVKGQYGFSNETTSEMMIRAEKMISGKMITPTNLQSLIMSVTLGRSDVFSTLLAGQMRDLETTSAKVAEKNEEMNAIRAEMVNQKSGDQDYKENQKDLQRLQTELDELSNISQRQMIQLNMYVHKYEEAVKTGSDMEKAFNDANQAIQGNLK